MPATHTETHNAAVLRDNLLLLSFSHVWTEAKCEWELECVHLLDADDEPRRCLCSHCCAKATRCCAVRGTCCCHNRLRGCSTPRWQR